MGKEKERRRRNEEERRRRGRVKISHERKRDICSNIVVFVYTHGRKSYFGDFRAWSILCESVYKLLYVSPFLCFALLPIFPAPSPPISAAHYSSICLCIDELRGKTLLALAKGRVVYLVSTCSHSWLRSIAPCCLTP